MNEVKLLLHQQDACVIIYWDVNFRYVQCREEITKSLRVIKRLVFIKISKSMLPTVGRQSTDRLLTDHQQSVDSRQTDHSTDSTGCRPTAGNLLVFSWRTVGPLSADRLPTVGQQSVEGSCSSQLP